MVPVGGDTVAISVGADGGGTTGFDAVAGSGAGDSTGGTGVVTGAGLTTGGATTTGGAFVTAVGAGAGCGFGWPMRISDGTTGGGGVGWITTGGAGGGTLVGAGGTGHAGKLGIDTAPGGSPKFAPT